MATLLTTLSPGAPTSSWFTLASGNFVVYCTAGAVGVESRVAATPTATGRVGDLVNARVTPIVVEGGTCAPFGVDLDATVEYRLVAAGVTPGLAAATVWTT